jgi:hypothetical protein
MKYVLICVAIIVATGAARAEDSAPSRIDSITKSARDMMPVMPAMPSVSLPSMPDLSDASGRLMSEFNTFTQHDIFQHCHRGLCGLFNALLSAASKRAFASLSGLLIIGFLSHVLA